MMLLLAVFVFFLCVSVLLSSSCLTVYAPVSAGSHVYERKIKRKDVLFIKLSRQ